MRPIIQLFAKLLSPETRKFHQALQDPQTAQKQVQKEIFQRLAASEYGKSVGVRSLEDWQKIPIVNYTDLELWIERQKQSQQALLTSESILFYEKTSGSRGAAKWIPYTRSLRRSFSRMFCVWAHDLITNGPKFSTGQVYFCISPQLTQPTQTEAGIQVGLENDAEYLDGWLQWILRTFLVAPADLSRLRDPEAFKEQLCLALLQAEKLEIISIWSPSFLTVHLDYIQQHRQKLCDQLRDRVSPQRLALLSNPTTTWTQIWLHLKLISCWDSVNAADQAQVLQSHFPGVMVQGKGLLATEAPMTVPLIAAQGSVPLLHEVFFEFEDSGGSIHLLHELEPATEYTVILSQKGGLYRYRMGDRVRMTHTYLNTSCLEFLGRDQMTSDLVGEKLHTAFVAQVLDRLNLGSTTFRTLIPVTQPQPHYVLLLDQADRPGDAIAQQLDAALSKSFHYQQARLLEQLAPAQVWVSPEVPELVLQQKLKAGQKWGDIKHEVLATKPVETLPLIGFSSSKVG